MLRTIVLIAGLTATISWNTTLESQTTTGHQAPVQQTSTAAPWEIAAGGKMAFDVASIKQNKSEAKPASNVKLNNARNAYPPNGGVFTATNWPLAIYIAFAYKLSNQQLILMAKSLPKWASEERFDIEGKSENHSPTRDQMRLMLQAVLEDRFQLVSRKEIQQLPAFAVSLAEPGKTGPNLKQHTADSPCSATVSTQQSDPVEKLLKAWPPNCNHVRFSEIPGGIRAAGRDVGMVDVMDTLTSIGVGDGDRIFVDQTGLSGNFDFVMDFTEVPKPSSAREGSQAPTENSLPMFGDAVRDELGLKLVKKTMPTDCFVVVYLEHPSAN